MALTRKALAVLREAEAKLCDFVPDALAKGRYEDAGHLMELARTLSDARSPETNHGAGKRARTRASGTQAGATRPRKARPASRTRQAKRNAKGKGSAYPKFFREGDSLLKLGWSRKSKSAYEHRAPRDAVFAVAKRVAEVALTRSRFMVEDLGDVCIAQGEVPISGCQVYLCIAWFRRAGLVVQHGRRGYSLPVAAAKFPAKVKSAWQELPER